MGKTGREREAETGGEKWKGEGRAGRWGKTERERGDDEEAPERSICGLGWERSTALGLGWGAGGLLLACFLGARRVSGTGSYRTSPSLLHPTGLAFRPLSSPHGADSTRFIPKWMKSPLGIENQGRYHFEVRLISSSKGPRMFHECHF
jgi:hypothetical protein